MGPLAAERPSGILVSLPLFYWVAAIGYGCGDNSRGGDWFRLRWLIQGKRAEGCDYDLVNPVAAH